MPAEEATPERTQQHLARFADALHALRRGDFTRQLPTVGEGLPDALADAAVAYNDTVRLLNTLAYEFTRIAREAGTEGRFGGQAEAPGAHGTWAEMVTGVNAMSANLTNQVRDLSQTARAAVRDGDGATPRPLTCGAQGEMAELFEAVGALAARASGTPTPRA